MKIYILIKNFKEKHRTHTSVMSHSPIIYIHLNRNVNDITSQKKMENVITLQIYIIFVNNIVFPCKIKKKKQLGLLFLVNKHKT